MKASLLSSLPRSFIVVTALVFEIGCFSGLGGLASPAWAAPVVLDRLEASVNSSMILLTDVYRFRQSIGLRAQLIPLFMSTVVGQKGSKATDAEIVDFLIDERLITDTYPAADSEVEQDISQVQNNLHIDRDRLKQMLHDQGYDFDEYFDLMRVSASERALIDRDIRTKVTISDDDVKNYIVNHAGQSALPMSYQIGLIAISNRSYKTAAAAREAAGRASKEIKAGDSFEEVAKRSSDDPSASSGGDLGELAEDQLSPVIRQQLKKMQIGQVSDPLANGKTGYIIIKLKDVKSGTSERFDKMKEDIRNQLNSAEYQRQIQLWLERQRQSAFIHKAGENSVAGLPRAP